MVPPARSRHRGAMFIPFISVTLIGLAVAARRQNSRVGLGPLVGAGLVGAWIGFAVFGTAGIVADLILFGGFWPLLFGHLGALGTARLAVGNRAKAALPA